MLRRVKFTAVLFFVVNLLFSQNPSLQNLNFELSPSASIDSVNAVDGWTFKQNYVWTNNPCISAQQTNTFITPNSQIVSTPLSSLMMVPPSPLGGTKVAKLGNFGGAGVCAALSKTINITSNHQVIKYAWMAIMSIGNHSCCESQQAIILFKDTLGNPIANFCDSIRGSQSSCYSGNGIWSTQGNMEYTNSWRTKLIDLSPYIGSKIVIQAFATDCVAQGHYANLFFDAIAIEEIKINNTFVLSGSTFTLCTGTASVAAPFGFTSYVWNGPAASGIQSVTTSSFMTTTPGTYTLTVNNNTLAAPYYVTIHKTNGYTSIQPSASAVCPGSSVTLNASGLAVSNFTWNNSFSGLTHTVSSLTTSTIFTLTATDSLNCIHQSTVAIIVHPNNSVTVTATKDTICPGEVVSLSASSNVASTFQWNAGQIGISITETPTITSNYVVTATTVNNNCKNYGWKIIEVTPCASMLELEKQDDNSLIFPNPSYGDVTLFSHQSAIVKIYTAVGHLISESSIAANSNYKISLAPGTYLITVNSRIYKLAILN